MDTVVIVGYAKRTNGVFACALLDILVLLSFFSFFFNVLVLNCMKKNG